MKKKMNGENPQTSNNLICKMHDMYNHDPKITGEKEQNKYLK
jgi:hypothetical protein